MTIWSFGPLIARVHNETLLTCRKCRAWLSCSKRGGHKLMICFRWHNIIWLTIIHMLLRSLFYLSLVCQAQRVHRHDALLSSENMLDWSKCMGITITWHELMIIVLRLLVQSSLLACRKRHPTIAQCGNTKCNITSTISHKYKCTLCTSWI